MFKKKIIVKVLELAVTFTAFIILISMVNLKTLCNCVANISPKALIVIITLSILSIVLQMQMWKKLLHYTTQGAQVTAIYESFFAGYALRILIPGGHLGSMKIFLLNGGSKKGYLNAFIMEQLVHTIVKLTLLLILFLSFNSIYTIPTIIFSSIILFIMVLFLRILHPELLKKFTKTVLNRFTQIFGSTLYASLIFLFLVFQYNVLIKDITDVSFLTVFHLVACIWSSTLLPIGGVLLSLQGLVAKHFFTNDRISSFMAVMPVFIYLTNTIPCVIIGLLILLKNKEKFKINIETFYNQTIANKRIKKNIFDYLAGKKDSTLINLENLPKKSLLNNNNIMID